MIKCTETKRLFLYLITFTIVFALLGCNSSLTSKQYPNQNPDAGNALQFSAQGSDDVNVSNIELDTDIPVPINPEEIQIGNKEYLCTLSVSCKNVIDNPGSVDEEILELLPPTGYIIDKLSASFYEGESVFNLLNRTLKKEKIHFEFTSTPVYNSVYIEGINNLYEFDGGELSGWVYLVNGKVPVYGCSSYPLSEGDFVELIYTLDLGNDIVSDYESTSQSAPQTD